MPVDIEDDLLKEKNPPPLDEDDIALLKTYVRFESRDCICYARRLSISNSRGLLGLAGSWDSLDSVSFC